MNPNPESAADRTAAAALPPPPELLASDLRAVLGDRVRTLTVARGEVTLEVRAADWLAVAGQLRDDPALGFEQAIDLCGVDYLQYGEGIWEGPRMAVVVHLLSIRHNRRLRLRMFCPDDDFPVAPSLIGIWPAVNWYEREAFDLYGIVFENHPDLRRILTDYGFVGHPFRKDFPTSGYMEMRYDPEQKRVVYQPVSIAPRNNVPRVVREEGYGVERVAGGAPGTGR